MNFDLFFHRNSPWPRLTPIACAICILIFCGLNMQGDNPTWSDYSRWGFFPDNVVWEGKPWVFITSAFVHLEIWHIAFNLYWLWILGNCLEEEVGPGYWLLFVLGAAWVSSALQLLTSGGLGIGMSGVGYALFGFGWIARRRMPAFSQILNQQTIITFLIWLVGCWVMTITGAMNIANAAHLFGMLFGMAVAALFVLRWRLPVSVIGFALLVVLSIVPLFWCPLSPEWRAIHAASLIQNRDVD